MTARFAWLLLVAWLAVACQQDTPQETAAPPVAELRVVTSGGFTAAYNILAPQFEAAYNVRLLTEYGASSGSAPDSIPKRLERGERFDVVILSRSSLDTLSDESFVLPDSRRNLVHSTIGMAVREGTAKPDISTPEAFLETLRNAESFAYSASTSGTYLSTVLLPELGVWEELAPKGRRIVSERVAAVVARGDAEIGFQQVSEILPVEGAEFVGPLPDEYQKTTVFSAGIVANSRNAVDAQKLIDYFASGSVADTIESTGLIAVVRLP